MIAVLNHLGGYQMDDTILTQLLDCYKTVYGAKLDSPATLFKMQQNLMEFVMGLGRKLENKVFEQAGSGYRGDRGEERQSIQVRRQAADVGTRVVWDDPLSTCVLYQ